MTPRGARFPIEARTTDGVRYLIRPIRADDARREREFIVALSPQSRYQRFQHNLREPGDALIARLVQVDFHRTMALVAVTGHGPDERIIATAQYAADDETSCEFAIVVADDWQCRGVGTTLAPVLFDYAAREGFAVIYGMILADNVRMIELAEWLGLSVEPHRAGDPTVRASRQLQWPPRKAPAHPTD
jgi:acetyltransferase